MQHEAIDDASQWMNGVARRELCGRSGVAGGDDALHLQVAKKRNALWMPGRLRRLGVDLKSEPVGRLLQFGELAARRNIEGT